MKLIALMVDPVLLASFERLSNGRNRSQLLRDAMYTYVWETVRNKGANAKRAPICVRGYELGSMRMADGVAVSVDEWGLLKE